MEWIVEIIYIVAVAFILNQFESRTQLTSAYNTSYTTFNIYQINLLAEQ
jgi:hypothetical protein